MTTYYYRTSAGESGSTTSVESIPAGATVERVETTNSDNGNTITSWDTPVDDESWLLEGTASITGGLITLSATAGSADGGRASASRAPTASIPSGLELVADPLAFDAIIRVASLTGNSDSYGGLYVRYRGSDEIRFWYDAGGNVQCGYAGNSWVLITSVAAGVVFDGTQWLKLSVRASIIEFWYGNGSSSEPPSETAWSRLATYDSSANRASTFRILREIGPVATSYGASPVSATFDRLRIRNAGFVDRSWSTSTPPATTSRTIGPERNRPDAGTTGATYYATDSGIQWIDDGATWRVSGVGSPDTLTLTGWGTGFLTGTAEGTQDATPPCTIVVSFYLGTLPAGAQRIIVTFSDILGAGGWQMALCAPTANRIAWFGYGLSSEVEIPLDLTTGWHCAAFAISTSGADTIVRCGLDGTAYGPDTRTGTYAAPVAGHTFRIGAANNGTVPLQTDTGLAAFVYLNGALDAAELAAITALPSSGRIVAPSGHTETLGLRASRVGWQRNAGDLIFTSGTQPRPLTVTGIMIPILR